MPLSQSSCILRPFISDDVIFLNKYSARCLYRFGNDRAYDLYVVCVMLMILSNLGGSSRALSSTLVVTIVSSVNLIENPPRIRSEVILYLMSYTSLKHVVGFWAARY